MKNMKVWLILVLAIVGLMIVGCGAGEDTELPDVDDESTEAPETTDEDETVEDVEEDGTLVMGTSADYPPFESINEDGEFVGFDIELAEFIADELGLELEIRDMGFDGLIGALQQGRLDMVLAGMSATEDRRENVDFSIEYHSSGEMFVTRNDEPMTSLDDLEGLRLGVQLGTIQEEGALNLQEDYDFELRTLDEAQMLVQELITNRVDVIYLDREVALGFIESQDLAGFDDPTDVSPGMAVALPKDSPLLEQIDAAIEKAIDSGFIAELEEKWLSGEE